MALDPPWLELIGPTRQAGYDTRWRTVMLIVTFRHRFGMPSLWSERGLVTTRHVVADVGR